MVPDDPVGVIISVVVVSVIAGIFIKLISILIDSPVNIDSGDPFDELQMNFAIAGVDAIVWLAGGTLTVAAFIVGLLIYVLSQRR